MLFTIGRALSVGRREAFLSVVGNAFGILTQIVAIAVGLGPVVAASATVYEVIRIGGALYLIWLGVQAFRARHELVASLAGDLPATGSAGHSLRTGYVVGVTNPKTIVFFTALLPQFIDAAAPQWPQYATIAVVFAAIDFVVMFAYAAVGAHAMRLLKRRAVLWLDRCCGGCLLVLSGSLLLYRRQA